jgi:hypothetical protein
MPPNEASPPDGRRGRPLARKTAPTDPTAASVTPTIAWRTEAAKVLEALAHTGMPFHVADLLALTGYPPRPQQLGSAFAHAQQQRLIEVRGAAIAENRLVRVWVGVS